jgi:hypothetical protein
MAANVESTVVPNPAVAGETEENHETLRMAIGRAGARRDRQTRCALLKPDRRRERELEKQLQV